MIDPLKLHAIIETEVTDLRSLAHLAGGHPATFYRGANFDNTDLRGEDLRGFNLEAATFKRAKVDEATLVDTPYKVVLRDQQEVLIRVFLPDSVIGTLALFSNNYARQLGDTLEEMLALTRTRTSIHNPPAALDFLIDLFRLNNIDYFVSCIKRLRGEDFGKEIITSSSLSADFQDQEIKASFRDSHIDTAGARSHSIRLFDSYRELQSAFARAAPLPTSVSLQLRSAESLNEIAAAAKTPLSNLCCALLLAYAFK